MTGMITEIKMLAGNKTEIVCEDIIIKDQAKTSKKLAVNSTQPAHPDLQAAGDALVPYIEELYPFPDYTVEFKSVKIYRDDNGFSASYGIYLRPDNEDYSGNQWQIPKLMVDTPSGKNHLPPMLYEKTQDLIKEAQKFVEGKRAQADMFAAKPDDDRPKSDEEIDQEEEDKIAAPGKTRRRSRFLGGPTDTHATH